MTRVTPNGCDQVQVCMHALRTLPAEETAAMEAHLAGCAKCRADLAALGPVLAALAHWPTNVLRPATPLWERIAERAGVDPRAGADAAAKWREPEWEEVAPGISCKLLATDDERNRVSMLVRLAPRTSYPPHTHAGVEELHLLEGELWIEDRKLLPGDYNLGKAGMSDQRVYSETGCTCVLITSPADVLR